MSTAKRLPPFKIFLSYSHHDEDLCDRFLVHLAQLKREGLIEPWHDRKITAGSEWVGAIDDNLNAADVVVLLVSADFLASDYCNDIEIKRAMERSAGGGAQVVPVILRPCDWETSRFAQLQALPTGGKPVVDWKSEDHGFLDVAKELRRMLIELCGPAPVRTRVWVQTQVRRHPWRWAAISLIAVVLLIYGALWSASRSYLRQGTSLLDIGLYPEAKPALEQARRLSPLSGSAGCGLKAIEVDVLRSKPAEFEATLREASREYPHCAYLRLLLGDQKYIAGDREGALVEYQQAVQREPKLAEAYFNMGRIWELNGEPDKALAQYQKAAELSPGTPRYHNNLANLYFHGNEYDKAIAEYGQVTEFPLSALEAANIYRLQGKLEDAAGRELDAISWLKEGSVQLMEQKYGWDLDISPTQQVRLGPLPEKECYAELELATTKYLQGDAGSALIAVSANMAKCERRKKELSSILKWELYRLGGEVHQFTQRTDEFADKFLGGRYTVPN